MKIKDGTLPFPATLYIKRTSWKKSCDMSLAWQECTRSFRDSVSSDKMVGPDSAVVCHFHYDSGCGLT